MGLMRQNLLKRVSQNNDAPAAAVRPFDAEATGTAIGEGGGLLILEEYERAKARGAKIYAELVGFGASQDTYDVTRPDPSGHSYSKAIGKALADAKASADQVDAIVPHGLGIADFDAAELAGLARVFGDRLGAIPLAPIKAQIGNLAAGSGVDAATAALAVHHGKLPPAINTAKPARKLNVAATAREANLTTTISTVYSLGGQNAALVFRKA